MIFNFEVIMSDHCQEIVDNILFQKTTYKRNVNYYVSLPHTNM